MGCSKNGICTIFMGYEYEVCLFQTDMGYDKRIQGNMQKETIRELLTNYEAMMRNRVFVSLGIKQRNSRNAATRSLEPSISLGALMTLHRARLQLAKLHTVIIRTAYTMT